MSTKTQISSGGERRRCECAAARPAERWLCERRVAANTSAVKNIRWNARPRTVAPEVFTKGVLPVSNLALRRDIELLMRYVWW